MIKERINIAYNVAKHAHKDQQRKYSNLEYFVHCKAVARRIEELGGTEDMIITSLLHDTIEDTGIEYKDLEAVFDKTIADLVQELTSDKVKAKEIGKAVYLSEKMKNMSKEALTIKLADREHNVKFLAKDSDLSSKQAMKFVFKYYTETKLILEALENYSFTRVQFLLYESISLILQELDIRFSIEERF